MAFCIAFLFLLYKTHFKTNPLIYIVNYKQVCDFNDDCGDESDERNCAHQSSFRCSFEGGKKVSPTCNLDLTDAKWKRFTGIETQDFMGPGLDHTTDSDRGHFMMLTSAVFPQVTINTDTSMLTPLFDPDNSGNCQIRFWYMMNGGGSLSISRKTSGSTDLKLISTIDTSPNDTFVWKRYSEPLIAKLPYQIVLDGKIDNVNSKTFLAIDDISFTSACKLHSKHPPHHNNGTTQSPGSQCLIYDQFECSDGSCISFDEVCDFFPTCPQGDDESDCPSRCDFDKDAILDPLCYWGNNDDDAVPLKITATAESANTASKKAKFYPPTDNTLKTANGKFMLIYGINKTESVDVKLDLNIYSPEFVSAAPECTFSMDYYVATDSKFLFWIL